MTQDKKQRILDMLVNQYNKYSYLATVTAQSNLMLVSYTDKAMAREMLEIINELAYGELVDIKHKRRTCVDRIEYDVIIAEWA